MKRKFNWLASIVLISGASVLSACSDSKDNPIIPEPVYDENRPVGWASVDGTTTGSNDQNPVTVTTREDLIAALSGTDAKTIYVKGTILFDGVITIEGAANKTVYGLAGSVLQNPIHSADSLESGILLFKECHNIILRNLTFKSAGAYDIDGYDNLTLSGSHHVWVDHCDFQDGVDGNFDIILGSDNISVTWCRFRYLIEPWAGGEGGSDNHCNSNLVGNSDKLADIDANHLNVTFANCWWDEGCSERMPRMRFGKAHVYNCLFTCTGNVYCIGAGYACNIYAECNAFIGVNEPWRLWATKAGYTDYNITMTNNLGADDVKASSGDAPFYVPTYNYKKYEASKVQEVVGNPQTGAGATFVF